METRKFAVGIESIELLRMKADVNDLIGKRIHSIETANREERRALKVQLAEERELRRSSEIAFRNQIIAMEKERNVVLVEAQDKTRELDSMRVMHKNAEDKRRKREQDFAEMRNLWQADKQKLIAEQGELKAEMSAKLLSLTSKVLGLQNELETSRATTEKYLTWWYESRTEEIKLRQVKPELRAQKAKLKPAEAKLRAEKKRREISQVELREEIYKQLEDLNKRIQTAVSSLVKIQERRKELEEANEDLEVAQAKLLEENKKLREEKKSLATAHETAIRNILQEEREKSLCQICLDSPRDTICLPCAHFNYCYACLATHRQRSRTCPTCRIVLCGILKSDIAS